MTYAEGAVKYGARNWLKGIPASDLINHAIRHIYLWLGGDMSEDHLAHAVWNLLAVMHFEDTKPDMIDCGPNRTVCGICWPSCTSRIPSCDQFSRG